ncbi:MAG TPA: NUDIX hydrolase [Candidatus Fimivivens sp.]|nr:NUDIX hydrolase [Candidatus Fimivivens sp.]
MTEMTITSITKEPVVRFDGDSVSLPAEVEARVDAYWDGLISSGRPYTRGEVFTVTDSRTEDDTTKLTVERTDYAHYLYSRSVGLPDEFQVRIIHTAVLVETADGMVVIGRMGTHTAKPGTYQLCGGGIDDDDLRGDVFDLGHNTRKELREELGIDADDSDLVRPFAPAFFKEGGKTGAISVVYRVTIADTGEAFRKRYDTFADSLRAAGEKPEFDEIVLFDRGGSELRAFLSREEIVFDEYMVPFFGYLTEHDPAYRPDETRPSAS